MKKLISISAAIPIIIIVAIFATDNTYLFKAFTTVWLRGQTDVGIYDYTVRDTRVINSGVHQPWELDEKYNKIALSDKIKKHHKETESIAFLIIKDGKILNEQYYNEGGVDHLSTVWSVTKTYTSLSILLAIQQGLIDNIDEPLKKYLPKWNVEQKPALSLRHLASMNSGLNWNERDHSPLALIAKFNFYDDLNKLCLEKITAYGDPGSRQHYNSANTQILGSVLNNVLKEKKLSEFISDNFWKPLGYKNNGFYELDSEEAGNEKSFSGMVSCARDVARLGQVISDSGRWHNQTIIEPEFMDLIYGMPYNNKSYAFGCWSGTYNNKVYVSQVGFRGQFIISYPSKNLTIVRLGHHMLPKEDLEHLPSEINLFIEEALRVVEESIALN